MRFRVGATRFESALTGRHSVSNLLAGIAVAGDLRNRSGSPDGSRSEYSSPEKCAASASSTAAFLIYNDCYNSNPDAVRAMLEVLRDTPARRRIAVLGEMLELGRWAEPLHRDVGNYAAECGIDVLVGIRGAACHMLDAAKRCRPTGRRRIFFRRSGPRQADWCARSRSPAMPSCSRARAACTWSARWSSFSPPKRRRGS